MKKLLLIVGIVSIVVSVLFLLFALLNLFGFYNVFDGTPSLYNRLHHRMIIFSVIGIFFAAIGVMCLVFYSKK